MLKWQKANHSSSTSEESSDTTKVLSLTINAKPSDLQIKDTKFLTTEGAAKVTYNGYLSVPTIDMFTPAQWAAQWTGTISDSYSKDNEPLYFIEETSAQQARKLFNETLIHPPLLLSIRSPKVSVNAAQTEGSRVQSID